MSEYLAVYSKSPVTFLPDSDAKYVREFQRRGIILQGLKGLIVWMKQGRSDEARRGLEYWPTLRNVFTPIRRVPIWRLFPVLRPARVPICRLYLE